MAPAKQFIYDDAYWVIRVATGKQLDKNYKPYKLMSTVYDIYNFNTTGRDLVYRCGAKEHVCTDEELAKDEEDENEVYE
jgi:hypothetical protein